MYKTDKLEVFLPSFDSTAIMTLSLRSSASSQDEVRSGEDGELCVARVVSLLQPIRKSKGTASNHRSFLVCLHNFQFRFQTEIGQRVPLVYFQSICNT